MYKARWYGVVVIETLSPVLGVGTRAAEYCERVEAPTREFGHLSREDDTTCGLVAGLYPTLPEVDLSPRLLDRA